MFALFKLWWQNFLNIKDDTGESVKLGEESYAFIDKNPPHLVLDHIPLIPECLPQSMKQRFQDENDQIFFGEKDKPLIPECPPKSMKQRFQHAQYQAFDTKNHIDTPSTNTRSKKRRELNSVFTDCLTQSTPKTSNNHVKLPISYKKALTTTKPQ